MLGAARVAPLNLTATGFLPGMEVLTDVTELHLTSLCLADAELRLGGADDPVVSAFKARYADVFLELRLACRRTAAWSSSSRRATHRCRGPGR